MSSNFNDYTDYIYDYFANAFNNKIGACALMGNLQAESGNIPYRLQGDFNINYSKSIKYTQEVNDGIKSEHDFVHDSKGYGLAQWTFYTRKQALYDKHIQTGKSIGDITLQCEFLLEELQNDFPGVYDALINATDLKTASNKVLTDFENPRDQSQSVKDYRYSLSKGFYDHYSGGVIPPEPPPEPPQPEEKYIPPWLLFKLSE